MVKRARAPITLDLALKMEAAGWSTADVWMEFQTDYDLAQARKRLNQPLAKAPAVLREKQLAEAAQIAGGIGSCGSGVTGACSAAGAALRLRRPAAARRTLRRGKKTLACRNAPHYKK